MKTPGFIDEAQGGELRLWKVISVGSGTCVVEQVRNDAGDTISRTSRTVKYLPDAAPSVDDYGTVFRRADGYRFFFRRKSGLVKIPDWKLLNFVGASTILAELYETNMGIQVNSGTIYKLSSPLTLSGVPPGYGQFVHIVPWPLGFDLGQLITKFSATNVGGGIYMQLYAILENFNVSTLTPAEYLLLSKRELNANVFAYIGNFEHALPISFYESYHGVVNETWYGLSFIPIRWNVLPSDPLWSYRALFYEWILGFSDNRSLGYIVSNWYVGA